MDLHVNSRLQDAFITGFNDIIRESSMLSNKDWLLILPSDIGTSIFVGLYHCKSGIGSGINLNKFLVLSFTRLEAYKVIARMLDDIVSALAKGVQSEPVNIDSFSFEEEGHIAVKGKVVNTKGTGRIFTYTLEQKSVA